jgi:hypothetical protein
MATYVTHPTFYEGEILPAADLVASVDAARGQMARHERYLHTWGIASGLALTPASLTSTGSLVVPSGVAVDGTGRELVVASGITLTTADFQGQIYPTNDPATLYPVFITGADVPQISNATMTGACASSQPTSTQEVCNAAFGHPGDELNLDQQTNVGFADGPGDGVNTPAWKVLVGFVKWDAVNTQFSGVETYNPATKVGVRYAGVNAAQVVAENGSLLLATHPAGFTGGRTVLGLSLQEDPNGGMAFGTLNANGTVQAVLTISPQGDIKTSGQITGAIATGTVQVESGLATHGTVLPLPSGITQAQVDAGTAVVHAFVSLRLTGTESDPTPPPIIHLGAIPLECYVDASRTVHCRVRKLDLGPPPAFRDDPAVCEYMVVGVTKPK